VKPALLSHGSSTNGYLKHGLQPVLLIPDLHQLIWSSSSGTLCSPARLLCVKGSEDREVNQQSLTVNMSLDVKVRLVKRKQKTKQTIIFIYNILYLYYFYL